MNSPNLNNWKQEGELHFWRYTNSSKLRYPGLNVAGDLKGINSIISLFDFLLVAVSGSRTVQLSKPSSQVLSIPGNSHEYEWFEKIRLQFERDDEITKFTINGKELVLTFGIIDVTQIKEALVRYSLGDNDFSIPCVIQGGSKYDKSVWFW